jgi:hypothetical protein
VAEVEGCYTSLAKQFNSGACRMYGF